MKKIFGFIILFLFLIFLTATYGKWEYLTFVHGKEFSISNDVLKRCMLEKPQIMKVMDYHPLHAQILMKDDHGDRFVIYFSRDNIDSNWSLYYGDRAFDGRLIHVKDPTFSSNNEKDKPYCHHEMLDFGFYWYF